MKAYNNLADPALEAALATISCSLRYDYDSERTRNHGTRLGNNLADPGLDKVLKAFDSFIIESSPAK